MLDQRFQNPNHLDPAAALELFRAESNLQATALPPTVTVLDTPGGTFYDRSSVIATARHAAGLALHDASVIAVQSR